MQLNISNIKESSEFFQSYVITERDGLWARMSQVKMKVFLWALIIPLHGLEHRDTRERDLYTAYIGT